MEVKDTPEQPAIVRRIIRETNLHEIIKEKLSQEMRVKDIVKELVSQGACSRATAYRYVSRQSEHLKISAESH
jgi:hypothetical protein